MLHHQRRAEVSCLAADVLRDPILRDFRQRLEQKDRALVLNRHIDFRFHLPSPFQPNQSGGIQSRRLLFVMLAWTTSAAMNGTPAFSSAIFSASVQSALFRFVCPSMAFTSRMDTRRTRPPFSLRRIADRPPLRAFSCVTLNVVHKSLP